MFFGGSAARVLLAPLQGVPFHLGSIRGMLPPGTFPRTLRVQSHTDKMQSTSRKVSAVVIRCAIPRAHARFTKLTEKSRDSFRHNAEVQREGHMARVKDIEINHLAKSRVIFPVNLPVTGQPGGRIKSRMLRFLVIL